MEIPTNVQNTLPIVLREQLHVVDTYLVVQVCIFDTWKMSYQFVFVHLSLENFCKHCNINLITNLQKNTINYELYNHYMLSGYTRSVFIRIFLLSLAVMCHAVSTRMLSQAGRTTDEELEFMQQSMPLWTKQHLMTSVKRMT